MATYYGQRATAGLIITEGTSPSPNCPFLANPDLVARMRQDAPFNTPDMATFYVSGAKGYTDDPALVA